MVEIIIKRRIAPELANMEICTPQGKCAPIVLPSGDFSYDTTEEIKIYWDSLNEFQQRAVIKKYVEENKDLADIIKEEMKQ